MAGGYKQEYIQKIISSYPNVVYSKRYDYIAKKLEKGWEICRRLMDEDPWEPLYRIKFGDESDMTKWKIKTEAFASDRLSGTPKPFDDYYFSKEE